MVAKVSLPLNKYKVALLSMLSIAAIIGMGVNIFILKNHFTSLVFSQVIYIIILALVISTVHFFTRRNVRK